MAHQKRTIEEIHPGDTVTIENTGSRAISLGIEIGERTTLDLDLAPSQMIKLSSGELAASIVLHDGDPGDILMVKPEPPS